MAVPLPTTSSDVFCISLRTFYEAFKYLSAAFTKASEKAENFYNLDIPSLTASIGRCYYTQGIKEKQLGNLSCAKEIFEKSIGYYTKAMALDTQMNLHKYDNFACSQRWNV
jgi:hypothetical protein